MAVGVVAVAIVAVMVAAIIIEGGSKQSLAIRGGTKQSLQRIQRVINQNKEISSKVPGISI